jgi:hypothetical protein
VLNANQNVCELVYNTFVVWKEIQKYYVSIEENFNIEIFE